MAQVGWRGGEFKRSSNYLYDGISVLFGRKGTIDKSLIVNGKFWTVDTMFYSVIFENSIAEYIHGQAILFPYDLLSTNTALPSMVQEDLLQLGFVIPPVDEQQKIANFLDHETAKIDTLIAKQEKLSRLGPVMLWVRNGCLVVHPIYLRQGRTPHLGPPPEGQECPRR